MDMLSLKNKNNWLVWRLEDQTNGKGKPRKVPYYAHTGIIRHGIQGSPEDRGQLVDFASAKQFATENDYTGVGLALTEDLGITCLDFDNCLSDNALVFSDIERITIGTYAEVSPSGKGIRAIVAGSLGNSKSPTTDGQYGFELFSTKGFVTFTEDATELTGMTGDLNTIAEPNEALLELIKERFGKAEDSPKLSLGTQSEPMSVPHAVRIELQVLQEALQWVEADDYDTWLRVGMALHYEMDGSDDGFILWDSWSANSPKYSTEESNRFKWDSFSVGTNSPITGGSLLKMANDNGAGIGRTTLSDSDFAPIEDEPGRTTPYFPSISFKDLCRRRNNGQWLIKDFLPKAALGVIYGASMSGKSFVALDICASLARGKDWNGLRCQKIRNKILYIVAEGVGGVPKRLAAYCKKEGIADTDIDIQFITDTPLNLGKGGNADKLAADAKFYTDIDIIVVDTFAQVTPGMNESDSADMSIALAYCKKIHDAFGAMVLLIHHTGKDTSRGARGHSSLQGAADVMFEVTKDGDTRSIKIVKQKDGEDDKLFGFKLVTVQTGVAELSDRDIAEGLTEGDAIYSCYVEYCDAIVPVKNIKKGSRQLMLDAALAETTPGSYVSMNELVDRCMAALPEGSNIRRGNLFESIKSLVTRGVYKQHENGSILSP